ncbi:hypothetical protein [Arcobacter sp.]|uniref:hypothetical protein n=1 Tax=Arcobacter sp. TaxID=1872629 RepID=UPI003D0D9030
MKNKTKYDLEEKIVNVLSNLLKEPLYQLFTMSSGTLLNAEMNLANEKMYKETLELVSKNTKEIIETIDIFINSLNDEIEESFNLGNCIQTMTKLIQPFLKSNNIFVHINYSYDIKIVGIEVKLIQVFLNIINNIIYILEQNKTLREKHIFIEAKSVNEKVEIKIKDNGGTTKSDDKNSFLKNFNISKKIALARKIVKEHFFGNIKIYDEGYSFNNKMFNGRVVCITLN